MKNSKRKHNKRCNGTLVRKEVTPTAKVMKCEKCGWETRYYRRRKQND